jgi:hypothetical protein
LSTLDQNRSMSSGRKSMIYAYPQYAVCQGEA